MGGTRAGWRVGTRRAGAGPPCPGSQLPGGGRRAAAERSRPAPRLGGLAEDTGPVAAGRRTVRPPRGWRRRLPAPTRPHPRSHLPFGRLVPAVQRPLLPEALTLLCPQEASSVDKGCLLPIVPRAHSRICPLCPHTAVLPPALLTGLASLLRATSCPGAQVLLFWAAQPRWWRCRSARPGGSDARDSPGRSLGDGQGCAAGGCSCSRPHGAQLFRYLSLYRLQCGGFLPTSSPFLQNKTKQKKKTSSGPLNRTPLVEEETQNSTYAFFSFPCVL